MADKVLSANRSQLGHSFLNAMWIAGFLAAIQIVAVATAVIKRSPMPEQPVVATPATNVTIPDDFDPSPPLATEGPPEVPTNIPTESPQIDPQPTAPVTDSKVNRMPAPDLNEITDPVGDVNDSLISILIESGMEDRERGDLEGALSAFLDAEKNLPDHPRVLSEIAGTYGEMGKINEATEYWTRVAEMGEIVAGPFYQIATKVLNGEDPSIPEVEIGKYLKIGKLDLKRQPVSSDGEWVTLTIPIVGKKGESISGKEMDLRVYFYDLINGVTPGQTTATISYDFPSKPYNWAENRTEEIEVIYHQPVFTVEQKQNLGERVYFGYVIELYYRNQLQDSVVSSDELRSLRFPVIEPVEEPISPQGPDTSLFPKNR